MAKNKTAKKIPLRQTQSLFWEGLISGDPESVSLKPILSTGSSGEPISERMQIYTNAYFLRILNVLAEDFAVTKQLLGSDHFVQLVHGYLEENISNHYSLRFMGKRFPEYLKSNHSLKDIPWALDLARFEWAKIDIFDGPEHTVLTIAELSGVKQAEWPTLKFKLIPSLTLLRTNYRVEDLAPETTSCENKTGTLKLWRKEEQVYYCLCTPEELVMFSLIKAGKDFSQICEAIGDAQKVFTVLSRWIEDQLLANFFA